MKNSALGFSLYPIASPQDLRDACEVRVRAYAHHLPELAERLAEPDEIDRHPATTVFLCRDKVSGRAMGTMRIQTSEHGPLVLERGIALPPPLAQLQRAEITRLAVRTGADPLTKLCLMKASYLFCMVRRVQAMVIGARKEALIRTYRRLGFRDVFGEGELKPLAHTGGLLHRILCFDVASAEQTWAQDRHPLYSFMVGTIHDDLQVVHPVASPLRAALAGLPLPALAALNPAGA